MWNKESFESKDNEYRVLFFELSKEKAIERLLWRMYDPISWETFISWTKVNPKTKTKLIKRHDDNEKSILARIENYVNITLPVIEI